MFEVYFRQSNGEDKYLINCKDFFTVNKFINSFLEQHNFKSYYSRMSIISPGVMEIDVGSHVESFIIKGPVENVIKNLK